LAAHVLWHPTGLRFGFRLLFIALKLEFQQREEEKGLINYPALTINRHTDHITIEIYRKLTSTDAAIHCKSNHPMKHEIAACCYLINTVNNLPITAHKKKHELHDIKSKTKNSGFPTRIIRSLYDTMMHKKPNRQKKTNKQTNKQKQKKKWISFTYHSPLTKKK
jgi:hypothetical protein